jgi:hypothetical protein
LGVSIKEAELRRNGEFGVSGYLESKEIRATKELGYHNDVGKGGVFCFGRRKRRRRGRKREGRAKKKERRGGERGATKGERSCREPRPVGPWRLVR